MTNPESRWDGVKGPDCGAETGNALHNISYCVIEYVWERTVQHLYFSTLSSYISWKIKKITVTNFFRGTQRYTYINASPRVVGGATVFCTHTRVKKLSRVVFPWALSLASTLYTKDPLTGSAQENSLNWHLLNGWCGGCGIMAGRRLFNATRKTSSSWLGDYRGKNGCA